MPLSARLKARCPGHDDQIPSLLVTVKDGELALTCFAGCSLDQIMRGLKKQRAGLKRLQERQAKSEALVASGTAFLSGAASAGAKYYREGKA